MIMCKINICVLLIINLIYIIDGKCEMEVYKNEFEETDVGCNIMRVNLSESRKDVKCIPRMTLMKLYLNNEYTYYPKMISLQRCQGSCSLSCLPIKTQTKSITLQRSHINSSIVSCVTIEVEEHTQCKCGCDVMEEHCNKKQKYNKRACSCECKNYDEESECRKKSNMIWDPNNCKCMCNKSEETCSSGLMWVREQCACAKVIMNEDIDYNEIKI